jgi:hypothetical protein
MRRVILSILLGSLTLALLMVAAWMTAQNYDHNGPDTPLSRALSPFADWGVSVGAAFIHLVGENIVDRCRHCYRIRRAGSSHSLIYFMCFITVSRLRHYRE